MSNPTPRHAASTAAHSPFLRARLIFASLDDHLDIGDVFVHIASDVRCVRASSSNPQHADDFADSDVVIELKRAAESSDSSDDEAASVDEILSSAALADAVFDVVGPRSEHDDRTLSICGNVTTRERSQAGGTRGHAYSAARSSVIWLVAGSRDERDVWLLLLRARVAPVGMWRGVCRGHALKCESPSSVRLRSFWHDRSSQASEREIADALLGERSRWMRDNGGASEQAARLHGEGLEDDVSDSALLLHASVMQMVGLSTRVGAAASRAELRSWRAGAVALQSIDTYGKRVREAVYAVLSAAATTGRDSAMGEVMDAVIGYWDSVVRVEGTVRKIVSEGAVSEASRESVETCEEEARKFALSAGYAQQRLELLQERVELQRDARSSRSAESRQDGPYKASFRVDITCSFSVVKDGSPQYERIVSELLSTDAADDVQPVAVTSVSGEGGAGKTTTCVLALGDARVKAKYRDGVFGFEVGLDAQEKDLIGKVASVVELCQGFKTAHVVSQMTELAKAVTEARKFFFEKHILLYLDNAWPDSRGLEQLMSIASGRGSCVLFNTRSATLAQDYTDRVVELGTLRLDVPEEKTAAERIFHKHLGPHRQHRWCTVANVNEALSLSQGLPIAIATLAALIRNMLGRRITTNVLGQVSANLRSPLRSSPRNLAHMGLFAAMAESLEFLDRQRATPENVDGGPRGLMTRRYASLHALDRSEDRVDKAILSVLWDTSTDDAEGTAGEFFNLGLVTLASPSAAASAEEDEESRPDTLTLHDLQVEYSSQVAHSGRHGISVEEVHETAVRGMFEGSVDIDALDADDYVRRCEELCQADHRGENAVGRYVVSNLVRHLVGSLCAHNASRRWPTIRRVMSDARWLMVWQRVDGWSFVRNQYAMFRDVLSAKRGVVEVIPDAEVEALVDVGRAAQCVAVESRSCDGEEGERRAAAEMYLRLHAAWLEGDSRVSRAVLRRALQSLSGVAGRWWMRPMVACHEPPVRDRRLRTTFAASTQITWGCALIDNHGDIVTGSEDCVVRVHDCLGGVVAQHRTHSQAVRGVCVGRVGGDTEHRVLSVGDDGRFVRWDVSLPTDGAGRVRAAAPEVVDTTETLLTAVACSDDAMVVAAGCIAGVVYVWAFGGNESQPVDAWKFEAREHTDRVYCVAVSSDGATALSGSEDGTCRVWGVADALRGGARLYSRAVLGDRYGWGYSVQSCAFARADRVAVTGHSGAVRFWSLADARLLGEVDLQSVPVRSLAAIGRAGDEVVAGTGHGTAHVVRVSDRAVTAQLGRTDHDDVQSVSASRDDSRIVVCGHLSDQIKVWDAKRTADGGSSDAGTRAHVPRPLHFLSVYTVSTSSCGHFVVSGGYDGTVRCLCADTGRKLWARHCGSFVNCVCVSADAAHVACGCRDGTVLVLEMANGVVAREWKHDSVFSVCMHELRDDLVWTGHHNGEVVAWTRDTSTPAHRVQGLHGNWVTTLAVVAGGKCVYSQDHRCRTARIEISDDGTTSTTIVDDPPNDTAEPDRGNAFAEHTAHGFRTGGYDRRHSRVRHAHGGRMYDITATTPGASPVLNVVLRLPGCLETATLTTTFDSAISAVDASFVDNAEGALSFAQVVCGLLDGNVCILRQPLAEDTQHWHPAEALQ